MTDTSRADFVLFPVDGPVSYGHCRSGEEIGDAIRRHVPDLATQGARRLRLWFCDTFGDQAPNPTADAVIGRLGYQHPTGWYGPVAISMEEDATGEIPSLSPQVRAAIDELIEPGER